MFQKQKVKVQFPEVFNHYFLRKWANITLSQATLDKSEVFYKGFLNFYPPEIMMI